MNIGIALGVPFITKIKRILVKDSFNRADNVNLGNAETGQSWNIVGGGSCLSINGNQAKVTSLSADDLYVFYLIDCGKSNISASVKFSTIGPIQNLAVRVVDMNNFIIVRYNNSNYELYKRVNGAFTLLGTVSGGVNGDVLKISAIGTNIKLFKNNAVVLETNVSDFVNLTTHGIGFYNTTSVGTAFDDFKVEEA